MNAARDSELSSLSSDLHALLVRRSERIRTPEASPDAEDDSMWVASFVMGEREYALALSALRAAVPMRMLTPVPHSSSVVVGVLLFQGQVIAALSTATLLASGWSGDPTILLVVDAGGGHIVALDCAQVPKAVTLPLGRFRQAARLVDGPLVRTSIPGRGDVTVVDLPSLLQKHDYRGTDGGA
jgi:chemotaxis signal transduction protein